MIDNHIGNVFDGDPAEISPQDVVSIFTGPENRTGTKALVEWPELIEEHPAHGHVAAENKPARSDITHRVHTTVDPAALHIALYGAWQIERISEFDTTAAHDRFSIGSVVANEIAQMGAAQTTIIIGKDEKLASRSSNICIARPRETHVAFFENCRRAIRTRRPAS
jgi:hypothetical protein